MKICLKCKYNKSISNFYKDNTRKDGFCVYCQGCTRKYHKEYYLNNKKTIDEKQKEYAAKNVEKIKLKNKVHYQNNKEYYRLKHREYESKKRSIDVGYKLSKVLRDRLYKSLKNNQKSGSAVQDLGCSIKELKQWLEQQFQNGMSWDNYGKWHIDHIIPLSTVDLIDRNQLKKVCYWFNLRPMRGRENISRGNRIPAV